MTTLCKHLCLLGILLGAPGPARADLTLEEQANDGKHIRHLITRIHGEKMRLDVAKDTNAISVIVDLDTRDSLTLVPAGKTYLQRTGEELKQAAVLRKNAAGTNAWDMDVPSSPAVDTGKREKIGNWDTEIFTWSGGRHLEETLWVARDFPNYPAIQAELAKVDRYNRGGAHRNGQPELSLLPGMVVRSEIATDGQRGTNTLVAATVDQLEAAPFQVPPDYTLWKPTPKPAVKAPTP